MKRIILFLIVIGGGSCQDVNSDFNPFDNEFQFHKGFRVSDYDTIMGECGYWFLTKRTNGIDAYYQFFTDEERIVAKGFEVFVDEIAEHNIDSLKSEKYVIQLLETHPIDLTEITQRLSIFKVKEIKIVSQADIYMFVELTDERDSIYTGSITTTVDDKGITRHLRYFNGK